MRNLLILAVVAVLTLSALLFAASQQPVSDPNSVSKMELRIALTIETVGQAAADQYAKDLAQKGPQAAGKTTDVAWFAARDGIITNNLITGEYQGQTYVLLKNKEPYIMLPSQSWGLLRVYSTTDQMGRLAVCFEFDENGSKHMYNLSKANIRKPLAIVVNGRVLSVPYINSVITRAGLIEGKFTKEEVDKLVDELQKGMPPVKVLGPIPAATGFEAPIERTLQNNEFIDFDKGKVYTMPLGLSPENVTDVNALMEWVLINGIDAQCAMTKSIGGLGGIGMRVAEPYRTAWDQMPATDVVYDIAHLGKADSVNISKPTLISSMAANADELPKTYLLKTREGRTGILQILAITQNPQAIKIHYKLVEKAPDPNSQSARQRKNCL